FFVGHFVKLATKPMLPLPEPSADRRNQWKILVKGDEGGTWLGHLERPFFFGAFWFDANVAVAGWLAFKVAFKWNAWTNVVAVPTELDGVDPIDFLIARRCWGSHKLMTFLLGTLANIVLGGLGVIVGKYILPLYWTH